MTRQLRNHRAIGGLAGFAPFDMRISSQTIFGALGAALVAAALWAVTTEADPGPLPKLRPTRDTTFLIAPLDDDGDVDYAAALNETYGRDVTPADNGLVALWNVWGPNAFRGPPPAEYFEALGMTPPPAEGTYLIDHSDYVREASGGGIGISEQLNEQFFTAIDGPWTARKLPGMAAWIERNDAPLVKVAAAVRRGRYYRPIVYSADSGDELLINAIMPRELGLMRDLGRLLVCRANLRIGEGKYAAAADDLLTCRRLGRMAGRGPGYYDAMACFVVEVMAEYSERNLLQASGLTAAELRSYLEGLKALPPLPHPAEALNRTERFIYLDIVQRLREQDPAKLLKSFLLKNPARAARIDFEAVLRTGNRWFDRAVGSRRRPDRADRLTQMTQLRKELRGLEAKFAERAKQDGSIVDLIADDEFSDYCLATFFPGHELEPFGRYERLEQELDLSKLAVALALFRAERGRYPATLAELAPLEFKEAPRDRYWGAPLVYRAEADGYLLYSLGENGRDDGGVNKQDTPEMNDEFDDRVVRISKAK